VKVEDGEFELAGDRAIVVFASSRSPLTNISRHANARNVEISSQSATARTSASTSRRRCTGFDAEAAAKKETFGLLGIRERAIMLHRRTLNICSVPGEGTQISLSISGPGT